MKKSLIILLCFFSALTIEAQENKKFSPEKFDAEMEAYITKEAALTSQEAAKFIPIFKEMRQKQRQLFNDTRKIGKHKPADEAGCANAIRQRDKLNVDLKKIEQIYHNKFMHVLPASKVYDVIKAEDRFHRNMMKKWVKKHQQPAPMDKHR